MFWEDLRTFYYLVKINNIKSVGLFLKIHYSTVLRRIRHLEGIFETQLFRNKKDLFLSEFGEELFKMIYKSCKNFESLNFLNKENILKYHKKEKFNIYITDIYYYNVLHYLYENKILCSSFFHVTLISITNEQFIRDLIVSNNKNFLYITSDDVKSIYYKSYKKYITLPILKIPIFLCTNSNNNHFIKYNGNEEWIYNAYNINIVNDSFNEKEIIYSNSLEILNKMINCGLNGIVPSLDKKINSNHKKIKEQKLLLVFHEDNIIIQKFFCFENVII